MAIETIMLRFSYHEEEWIDEIEDDDAAAAQYLRQATEGEWTIYDRSAPGEWSNYPTLEAFVAAAEEELVDDGPEQALVRHGIVSMSVDAVRIPVDRLRKIMADGGWTYTAARFWIFEGHHNDTELIVRLTRTT